MVAVAVVVIVLFLLFLATPRKKRRGGQVRPRMTPPAPRSRPPVTSLPPPTVSPLAFMPCVERETVVTGVPRPKGPLPGEELLDPNWGWALESRPGKDDEWVRLGCKHLEWEPVMTGDVAVATMCTTPGCGKVVRISPEEVL